MDKNIKIAIIGAGPGGLGAAERLKELGYNNITIFEKSSHAGGMVLSEEYLAPSGKKIIYEMGSIQPTKSKPLHNLFKKYQVEIKKELDHRSVLNIKVYSLEKNKAIADYRKYLIGYPLSKIVGVTIDRIKLLFGLLPFFKLVKPGFSNLDPALLDKASMSFEEFIDTLNLSSIKDELKVAGSVVNFSNPKIKNELPIIVTAKILFNIIQIPQRYVNGKVVMIGDGYQSLWLKAAKSHNVIYDANIESIERNEKGVKINFNHQAMQFDKLIVTCSLTNALKMLDATPIEHQLFEKVRYCPGWRVAFVAKNLPHDALYALVEPYFNENHPPVLQSFYPEGKIDENTWLYTGFCNSSDPAAIEEIKVNTASLLKKYFNVSEIEWVNQCYWPEFGPFFSREDVKKNIFHQIDSIQGVNNTYYLGGTISGGTNAVVVDYSYARIDEFFK